MAEVRRRPEVLPEAPPVRRLPIRDSPVGFLSMPPRVGPMESEVGRVRRSRLRAGSHRRRYPAAVLLCRPVAGDIPHRAGE